MPKKKLYIPDMAVIPDKHKTNQILRLTPMEKEFFLILQIETNVIKYPTSQGKLKL
jgi:hypothetical protein